MIKICFVCSGNTCRSIMAERLMKKILKTRKISDVKVFSKGLYANGENITDYAKRVLKMHKALSSNRKSVKLKKIEKDTLYIVMTQEMKQKLATDKVLTMKALIGRDITDPYGQSEDVYKSTALEIIEGIEKIIQNIIMWREK